ncbi:hypothetical protein C8J26_3097 [Sphingomonas aurantiaca]|uniref:Uncharacterized protein n=1 Tax=Sphingomonas aurantiaca TaxID=185949 RepID=A0A2T5GJ60_9SPHN|nr:hypothetical protein [Sphingomonas aurantiaca]PTQ59353.1 hypothetical protein C8J26_3097 [Sphingomonas aurantiaca]
MAIEPATGEARRSFLSGRAVDVPETRYKADFELLDRYLGFSSELLRMALAGMAAFGAIVGLLTNNGEFGRPLHGRAFVVIAALALSMLAMSAGCALLHRYLASDGMFHHLRSAKYLVVQGDEDVQHDKSALAGLSARVEADEAMRNARYNWAGGILFASGGFLMAGVVLLGASVVVVLTL